MDLLDRELSRVDWGGALVVRWWWRGLAGKEAPYGGTQYGSQYHLVVAVEPGRAWHVWLPFMALPEIIAGAVSPDGLADLGTFWGDPEPVAAEIREGIADLVGVNRRGSDVSGHDEIDVPTLDQLHGFGALNAVANGRALALGDEVWLLEWRTPDGSICVVPGNSADLARGIPEITSFECFPGTTMRSTNDGERWEIRALNTWNPAR